MFILCFKVSFWILSLLFWSFAADLGICSWLELIYYCLRDVFSDYWLSIWFPLKSLMRNWGSGLSWWRNTVNMILVIVVKAWPEDWLSIFLKIIWRIIIALRAIRLTRWRRESWSHHLWNSFIIRISRFDWVSPFLFKWLIPPHHWDRPHIRRVQSLESIGSIRRLWKRRSILCRNKILWWRIWSIH